MTDCMSNKKNIINIYNRILNNHSIEILWCLRNQKTDIIFYFYFLSNVVFLLFCHSEEQYDKNHVHYINIYIYNYS